MIFCSAWVTWRPDRWCRELWEPQPVPSFPSLGRFATLNYLIYICVPVAHCRVTEAKGGARGVAKKEKKGPSPRKERTHIYLNGRKGKKNARSNNWLM